MVEEGDWRTICPDDCITEEGNPRSLRPILHLPFDEALYHELNIERFELDREAPLQPPQGINDDRFWTLALAVYAAEQAQLPASRLIARII